VFADGFITWKRGKYENGTRIERHRALTRNHPVNLFIYCHTRVISHRSDFLFRENKRMCEISLSGAESAAPSPDQLSRTLITSDNERGALLISTSNRLIFPRESAGLCRAEQLSSRRSCVAEESRVPPSHLFHSPPFAHSASKVRR